MKMKIIFCAILLMVPIMLLGIISGNDTEEAYDETGSTTSHEGTSRTTSRAPQIKGLIIKGAGYYLDSFSDINKFLSGVEMSGLYGVDYSSLSDHLNNARQYMEAARKSYYELTNHAAGTPYRTDVIERLKAFDYDNFIKSNSHLNPLVFQEVKAYMIKGNVTGFYERLFAKTGDILNLIDVLKESIDNNRPPDALYLWEVSQLYADSLSFGQYATRIWRAIK